jgi:uncharacterized protein (DUF2141 family)
VSFLVLWLLLGFMPAQVRDAGMPPTTGTASISGVVVDDRQPGRAVRRAVVTLTGDGLHPNRGAITDDDGRFALRDLPAGRFSLTVERGAFVTSAYGAKRPGRAGTAITVTAGQQIDNLRVRLWRGAVLAGVLRDEAGAPLADTPVAAIPVREVTIGGLTLSNNSGATTDDQGEFRIFGLEPGTYVVRAGAAQLGRGEVAASEAEIDATFAALAARAGQAGAAPQPVGSVPAPDTIVNAAPFYFPGTPVAADATPITLAAGEERGGLDFAVRRIRTATIRGMVVGPDGAPIASAFVHLAAVTGAVVIPGAVPAPATISTGADGAFALGPISPGDYRLLARGSVAPPSAPGGGLATGPFWWASVPVAVTGGDVDLAALALQPGMTWSGRVTFDGAATTPAPDPAGLRIQLEASSLANAPTQGRGRPMTSTVRFMQPAAVRPDGTFEVTNLVPDDYRISVTGIDDTRWWLRAALVGGVDLLDAPLRLAPGENVEGVTLVLTDRRSELSGTLQTAAGAAVSDVFVLVFPAEAALRVPRSRRIQAARPDSSGRFIFANLPAGEYLICALTDVDDGQWNDAGFLDPFAQASVKILLTDGEKKVQDLRLGGG